MGSTGVTYDLLTLTPEQRMDWFQQQPDFEQRQIFAAFTRSHGTPYAFWLDDPDGFVKYVLNDFLWSEQNAILTDVRDHPRVAVPAAAGPGKTYTAARLVAWFVCVHEPGSATVVTTAPTFRQVRGLLWPHIRGLVAKYELPGHETCNQVEWRVPLASGSDHIAAFGFAPNKNDEAASQGIHAERILVIVDEAGGMASRIGSNLDALLTSEYSRILAIGNPPVDEQGTWFEEICGSQMWHVRRIGAYDSPNLTGEPVPDFVARNIVTRHWVETMTQLHGEESNWVKAKIYALFPTGSATKAVPRDWIDRCLITDDDDLDDLAQSDWQRLGVDVASDGGDEVVIAHWDGNIGRIVETSVAADNADQSVVAERILDWIHHCQAIQDQRGYDSQRVRVKLDTIGVGRGAFDLLTRWGKEGKHQADIVAVNFSEPPIDKGQFLNRRIEAWWTIREEIRQLNLRLDVDEQVIKQLNGPVWFNNPAGKKQLEKKKDVAARIGGSPDRADALILGLYEPEIVVHTETYAKKRPTRRSMPRMPTSRH